MKRNVKDFIAFKHGQIRMPEHLKPRKEESVRIYKNKVMEFLSRSPFGVPHSMWIIVAAFFFWYSLTALDMPVLYVALTGIAGFFTWTIAEYLIHRFVYHTETNSKGISFFQKYIHGTHHHYPKDPERLALPPVPGLIYGSIFLGLFYLFFGQYAFAFFPGFMLGYDAYITLHYFQHKIKSPNYKPWKKLWQHHKAHHYSNPYSAFGVSTRLWDLVFGTMPKDSNKKRKTELKAA